jgi:dolichol-phosphate mannosyltransferase
LLKATENKDIAIGSRYIPFGKITDWGLDRRALSYMANPYVRFWLGLRVRDCTSGFRCFKREVLDNIRLETIKSNGYLFQIEIFTRCLRFGYRFKEIPITFVERKKGKTKLGFYEIWEAVWGVLRLHFNRIRP